MRKTTTFCLSVLFLLLCGFARGQGSYNSTSWKFSNPKQFGFTVFDVNYFDNNNVMAVGAGGGIAKSTDGGKNWTYGIFTFPTPAGVTTTSNFTDVHYITSTVAYASGSNGCLAKTTDGGATWSLVLSPLYANQKNINSVWFLNKDTGYIGGQFNTPDSLPKLYFTKNGGATWDSLNAPLGGKTRVGYINNPNLAPILLDVTAKAKEIMHIEFSSPNNGYIIGSGSPLFPTIPAASSTTCLPTGGTTVTGSQSASLVWKFSNGTLTDYSVSKEKLGYSGINTNTVTCTTLYGSVTAQTQVFKALGIISDSSIVLMSFNNNIVIKINTGTNDSTLNLAVPGLYEKGKYQLLNFPFPPTGGPQAGPAIPPTQVLLASNPYQMRKASNGKLYAPANNGFLWTSVDTGRTWRQENSFVANTNFSSFGSWAIDIAPNGKFLILGSMGAESDSIAGGSMTSNYTVTAPQGSYNKIDFVDCNTAIAAGGGFITRTLDGGKTWIDNNRPDFTASFYSITGISYPNTSKAYFSVSNGFIYRSDNPTASQAAFIIDPLYSNSSYQMNDIVAIGNDTAYALGYASSLPTASRKSTIFRTYNNGVTWTPIDIVVTTTAPAFTAPTLSQLSFPSRNVGYAAGSRNGIYKTSDGGSTWTSINPFPALNQFPTGFPNTAITYTEIQALDDNTVFAVGNMFTNTGVRRVYRSTDGGASWVDITGNIPAALPVGNLTGLLFHDINNGYVIAGNSILKTSDGGVTWILDPSPASMIFQSMGFAPRTVPSGIPAQNRKVFVVGTGVQYTGLIMEYGNGQNINVNSTEALTGSCSNATQGVINITASGGLPPYTYSIDGVNFQTSNVFSGLTPGVKTITIKDAFCGILTKQVTVDVVQASVASAGPDKTIVEGGSVVLSGSADPGVASILWSPAASLNTATALTPKATPAATTVYTLVVTNVNGCTTTDQATVTVLPSCIKIMGAFTPNGDGMNDKWLVTSSSACFTQIKVTVFNRYGSVVYSDENYQNNWTGTYKGNNVPDGTYYYGIEYRLIDGRTIFLKGDVTILR